MITKNDIIADLHTHTVFSRHAYSTVKENIETAAENGCEFLAVTDHFYCDGSALDIKNEIIRMSYIGQNVTHPTTKVISGAEFNLNHYLDERVKKEKVYKNCKWRLCGLHTWFLDPKCTKIKDVSQYFNDAALGLSTIPNTCSNGQFLIRPTAFSHIERELFECPGASVDVVKNVLEDIVDIAVSNGIILEINESSILTNNDFNNHIELIKHWVPYALSKPEAMFSFGSDAHYCMSVGNLKNVIEIANFFDIKPERILNHRVNRDRLLNLLPSE